MSRIGFSGLGNMGLPMAVNLIKAGHAVEGVGGIVENANPGTLLIDCSTIDVETTRAVAAEAEKKGLLMLDAPVSGGVGGATAGTLTFMVGGSAQAFPRALSILEKMGKTIVHAGGP